MSMMRFVIYFVIYFAMRQIMFHNGQTDRNRRVLKCEWENTVNARRDRRIQQFSGIFCAVHQVAKITANANARLVKPHVQVMRSHNIVVCVRERHFGKNTQYIDSR